MSSAMNPNVEIGGSVVAYAPASSANLSVGFDVLGAALAPVDGSLLGDRVQVKSAEVPFALFRGPLRPQVAGRPEKEHPPRLLGRLWRGA